MRAIGIVAVAVLGLPAQSALAQDQSFPFDLKNRLRGQAPAIVETSDVDLDGHADLLFDRITSKGAALQWKPGTGRGRFGQRHTLARWDNHRIASVQVVDLDGQGGRDLLVVLRGKKGHGAKLLVHAEPAEFAIADSFPVHSEHAAVARVTGGEPRDVITAHPEGFEIREGIGDGTVASPEVVPVELPGAPGFGVLGPVEDLQGIVAGPLVPGDGGDIVARYDSGVAIFGGRVTLASAPGGGFEQQPFTWGERGVLAFLLAEDLDGDGLLDLLSGGTHPFAGEYLSVRFGTESGSFEERAGTETLGPEPGVLDADRDGDLDLVVPLTDRMYGTLIFAESGSGRVFAKSSQDEARMRAAGPVATADFDEDGWPDFATTVYHRIPRLTVWLNALGPES